MSWCNPSSRTPVCSNQECPDCKPHRAKELPVICGMTVRVGLPAEFVKAIPTGVYISPIRYDPNMNHFCFDLVSNEEFSIGGYKAPLATQGARLALFDITELIEPEK